ncbi:hypothetical protein ACFP1I_30810 [Dyadobacter subterraneus]|uniref:Uncharacterized protein n=1 Tax=Dyadobacter subterraneus TaxID=2773304 RepID=A0ABR9W9B2_9BACT|nr:hypothetical protein [Dyadobacter subterraneus]MBE9461709.1 hypothetical protein [Dyadobacter subterraneus]
MKITQRIIGYVIPVVYWPRKFIYPNYSRGTITVRLDSQPATEPDSQREKSKVVPENGIGRSAATENRFGERGK